MEVWALRNCFEASRVCVQDRNRNRRCRLALEVRMLSMRLVCLRVNLKFASRLYNLIIDGFYSSDELCELSYVHVQYIIQVTSFGPNRCCVVGLASGSCFYVVR